MALVINGAEVRAVVDWPWAQRQGVGKFGPGEWLTRIVT
jgi:hypothetical protein